LTSRKTTHDSLAHQNQAQRKGGSEKGGEKRPFGAGRNPPKGIHSWGGMPANRCIGERDRKSKQGWRTTKTPVRKKTTMGEHFGSVRFKEKIRGSKRKSNEG